MKNQFWLSLLFVAFALTACETLNESPTAHKPGQTQAAVPAKKPATTHKPASAVINSPAAVTQIDLQWNLLREELKKQNWSGVLQASESVLAQPPRTPALMAEAYHARVRAYAGLGDLPNAIATCEQASLKTVSPEKESFEAQGSDWISSALPEESLRQVASLLTTSEWKVRVELRQGQLSVASKDLDSARSFFGRAVNESPKSPEGIRAAELLSQLESSRKVEPKTVGVALPLTGKFASIGQKTLRGVQLGLGLDGEGLSTFRLAVVDTEGNSDTARRGVEQLVTDDNVVAIIGSVLSKTAPAVASRSSEMGVPSITLSQKPGVTELSSHVFRNAVTSEMQIRQLVQSSMQDMGLKKFAILYPNEQYGVEYANLFWDEVRARGGQIVAVQSYSPKETDFRFVVQRLVGTFYLEDRAEEYKTRLKEWSQAQGKRGANRNTPPEDLLPPLVDFDAIFIPDDSKALGQISAMLSYNNVKGVKLLGTNIWNVQGLAKRAGAFSNELLFVDSFLTSDPSFQNSGFAKSFRAVYGEDPGPFEVQGYDSAMLIRQLVMTGQTSREGLSSALSQVQGFSGAVGKISMMPSRELSRPMIALTLKGGEITPLLRPTSN